MPLQFQKEIKTKDKSSILKSQINEKIFTKDYVDFLNEAGWILEKKLPSQSNNYSDLLEDTDWNSSDLRLTKSIHYRRDLDALS